MLGNQATHCQTGISTDVAGSDNKQDLSQSILDISFGFTGIFDNATDELGGEEFGTEAHSIGQQGGIVSPPSPATFVDSLKP